MHYFFLSLLKNIDCGYSLEPPRRGGSNEYPQSMLRAEIWKISKFLSLFSMTIMLLSIPWDSMQWILHHLPPVKNSRLRQTTTVWHCVVYLTHLRLNNCPTVLYIEDIQMFGVNMTFVSSSEVKKCIFHEYRRHDWEWLSVHKKLINNK